MALRPHFYFQQAQYAQVFPLKPASFCKLFAGFDSTTSLPLLFSSYLILVLSSPLCPFLHLSFYLISGRNCFLFHPVLSRYNGSLDTRFSQGNDASDELARRGVLLLPSAIPCSLSPLTSRIHSSLFWTGGVLSHLNSSTHRFPRFSPKNLCFYVMLAVFFLAFAATDTVLC